MWIDATIDSGIYILHRSVAKYMIELEVKVPCPDLAILEARLEDLGAKRMEDLEQVDVYFSHPSRDFGSTDEALRLRSENGRSRLPYKGPKLDRETKMREEIELTVQDLELMSQLLQRVGFQPYLTVAKHRTVYELGSMHLCLDRVEGLEGYVELEYQGTDLEEGKALIIELKQKLGLVGNERRSYLELLMEKG
jgi:adenylate cyclase class 2